MDHPITTDAATTDRPPRWALLRSLVAIARDPNETSHGARLVLTFDRRRLEKNFQRFAADEFGQRVLAGAPSLFDLLTDRDALSRLPEGSLGRIYLDYMIREGISTEGLDAEVAPVECEVLGSDPARRRFHQHMRASHDLWHVLTGYHRDLLGELQLLTFSRYQNESPSFKWISRFARLGTGRRIPGANALLDRAAERGKSARWLTTVDWAPLLPRPIDDVRRELGVGPPPVYTRYVRAPKGFGLVPEETPG